MSIESSFTADHHGFYRDGKPFVPTESSIVHLRVPAALKDDLDWSKEKSLAETHIQSGKAILWELDLGLPSFAFHPDNTAAFFSFSVAIEEFVKTLWPAFHTNTFGVCLYRGGLPSQQQFPLAHWEAHLCRIQLLSEYLQRLVSFLPDSVLPFAFFSENLSPGKRAQLFSKARFEHIHLDLKCAPSTSLGLYLPADESIDDAVLAELDAILNQYTVRIIPEEKLTEQWDGIEKLIVPNHTISSTGRRKLLGFIAAGGEVVNKKEELIFS